MTRRHKWLADRKACRRRVQWLNKNSLLLTKAQTMSS